MTKGMFIFYFMNDLLSFLHPPSLTPSTLLRLIHMLIKHLSEHLHDICYECNPQYAQPENGPTTVGRYFGKNKYTWDNLKVQILERIPLDPGSIWILDPLDPRFSWILDPFRSCL